MIEIMKQGIILCDCGNEFGFCSILDEVRCMKCGKMYKNEGELVPIKEKIVEDEIEEE